MPGMAGSVLGFEGKKTRAKQFSQKGFFSVPFHQKQFQPLTELLESQDLLLELPDKREGTLGLILCFFSLLVLLRLFNNLHSSGRFLTCAACRSRAAQVLSSA